MSDIIEIVALVEGPTEQKFVREIVAPFFSLKSIFMTPVILSKPGQKGGDVRFERVKNDIGLHLKQRKDTYLTLLIDFYGIKGDWPGLDEARTKGTPKQKAEAFNEATRLKVIDLFSSYRPEKRFIPYVSMHEFEALLFSRPDILAARLGINETKVHEILAECGEPENINDSSLTAPSKRLARLSNRFKKTSTGIAILNAIGLDSMQKSCPLFNAWIQAIENLRA